MNFLSCHLHCLFFFKVQTCPFNNYFGCLLCIFQVLCQAFEVLSCLSSPPHISVIAMDSLSLYTVSANESAFQNFSHCFCRMISPAAPPGSSIPDFLSPKHCLLVALTHLPQMVLVLYFPLPSVSLLLSHLCFWKPLWKNHFWTSSVLSAPFPKFHLFLNYINFKTKKGNGGKKSHVYSYHEEGKRREEARKQTLGQRVSSISNKVGPQTPHMSLAEEGAGSKATIPLALAWSLRVYGSGRACHF